MDNQRAAYSLHFAAISRFFADVGSWLQKGIRQEVNCEFGKLYVWKSSGRFQRHMSIFRNDLGHNSPQGLTQSLAAPCGILIEISSKISELVSSNTFIIACRGSVKSLGPNENSSDIPPSSREAPSTPIGVGRGCGLTVRWSETVYKSYSYCHTQTIEE